MKIRSIALDEGGAPETVMAEMSAREAALIVRMIGPTYGSERAEFQHDGSQVGSDIYNCLSELFNRFYDDGINEVPE